MRYCALAAIASLCSLVVIAAGCREPRNEDQIAEQQQRFDDALAEVGR